MRQYLGITIHLHFRSDAGLVFYAFMVYITFRDD